MTLSAFSTCLDDNCTFYPFKFCKRTETLFNFFCSLFKFVSKVNLNSQFQHFKVSSKFYKRKGWRKLLSFQKSCYTYMPVPNLLLTPKAIEMSSSSNCRQRMGGGDWEGKRVNKGDQYIEVKCVDGETTNISIEWIAIFEPR